MTISDDEKYWRNQHLLYLRDVLARLDADPRIGGERREFHRSAMVSSIEKYERQIAAEGENKLK